MKRYGLRSTGETDTHDYFDKVLSRKGAAPATGRDTLIKLQGASREEIGHSRLRKQARGPTPTNHPNHIKRERSSRKRSTRADAV